MTLLLSVLLFYHRLSYLYILATVLQTSVTDCKSNFFFYWDCSNFFLSVGVWTVGNIGREEGTIHWALYGAYAAFPLYWYLEDDSTWYTLMTFVSALAFDIKSKKWRRKPKKQKSLLK